MRVVFYSRSCFLDYNLSKIDALSQLVELHYILELSPESSHTNIFEYDIPKVKAGIYAADNLLVSCFGFDVCKYWQKLSDFKIILHQCPKSIHPKTWKMSLKAANYIKALKPDIIHFDDISFRFAPMMPLLKKYPIILSVHDPEPHSGENHWKSRAARMLSYKFANSFILHNQYYRKFFIDRYKIQQENLHYVPLGAFNIFKEWIKKPVVEDEKTVLFIGRLSKYKGLETYIDAAKIISKKVSGVRFVIAGKPVANYKIPELPTLANKCLFENHFEYVPNDLMAEYYQRASMVVCPYLDATQSGIVLTAYAFGKPVIATRVGGLPEYIDDNKTGILVPPANSEALANSIIRLLQNPEVRKMMKKNIANKVETDLSWESIALQTLNVYDKLL